MLKSYVDKLKTKINPFVYGCWCCMRKGDKPFMRRNVRKILKEDLRKQLQGREYD